MILIGRNKKIKHVNILDIVELKENKKDKNRYDIIFLVRFYFL